MALSTSEGGTFKIAETRRRINRWKCGDKCIKDKMTAIMVIYP